MKEMGCFFPGNNSFLLAFVTPRFLLVGGAQKTSSSVWVNFAD